MEKQEMRKKPNKVIALVASLMLSMSMLVVSAQAETTDMTETNNKLDSIYNELSSFETGIYGHLTDIYLQALDTNYNLTNEKYPLLQGLKNIKENQVSQNAVMAQTIEKINNINTIQSFQLEQQVTGNKETKKHTDILAIISENTISINEALYKLVSANEADINNAELMQGLNSSIAELNETLETTNTYLGYMYAFFIFLLVVIISVIIWRLLNKTLINNMFRGS